MKKDKNFLMFANASFVLFFLIVMCLFAFVKHDLVGTTIAGFAAWYCLNEYDKRKGGEVSEYQNNW